MSLGTRSSEVMDWFDRLAEQGIDLTGNAHLKVVHEAKEFAEAPSLEEAADVYISLLGALHQMGLDHWDLTSAVRDKLSVNVKRTWHRMPDGTYQHD